MKTKAQKQAEHWFSMFQQYAAETGGFSADLSALEDSDLVTIKRVTRPFLDLAPRLIEAVRPQHRAEMRRAIAYLADLAERQSDALPKHLERLDRRGIELRAAYLEMQNPELSQIEKINLAKKHFGWDR